jgi:hypothetical protein
VDIDCSKQLDASLKSSCGVYSCNITTGCEFTKQECIAALTSNNAAIIAGATIGTAALIGIIIAAAVVFLGLSGAAGYGFYAVSKTDPNVQTTNNPIYAESGNSGSNPLSKV